MTIANLKFRAANRLTGAVMVICAATADKAREAAAAQWSVCFDSIRVAQINEDAA